MPAQFASGRYHRLLIFLLVMTGAVSAHAQQWRQFPPTPDLPKPDRSGIAAVNGVRIWYAVFGHGSPVIMVHGGAGSSEYWGLQIPTLARQYEVIVLDSRGHGRSTRNSEPITYHLMASDVLAVMDTLNVPKAALVGWSDGGIIGLDIAINHPERLTKLFAFGANSDTSGTKDVDRDALFSDYLDRCEKEYRKLSPTPSEYKAFLKQMQPMWESEPHVSDEQLRSIKTPTWIVDGDHDELIKREDTDRMARLIPAAGELILPEVSHFALLQDPAQFNEALLHFLSHPHAQDGEKRAARKREISNHSHVDNEEYLPTKLPTENGSYSPFQRLGSISGWNCAFESPVLPEKGWEWHWNQYIFGRTRIWLAAVANPMTRLRIQTYVLLLLMAGWPVCTLGQSALTLTYLGTAGWEITDGKTVILVDPYLTRLKSNTPNDTVLPSDPRPLVNLNDFVSSDPTVIDAHIKRADVILVTHTHSDHILDVPYIASKTGALVIGTESTANFSRDNGVPNSQILTVKGGEDLELGSCSVLVVPSLHGILRRAPGASQSRTDSLPSPSAIFPPDAKPPFRKSQLSLEGGTLAYLIRMGGQQVLVFGSMNYIEREVEGLRPDIALIGAMPERREIYQYTQRLLRALGYPRLVMPTHWDRFNVPYNVSQQPAIERVQSFVAEVKAASPRTEVIVPKYFEPVAVAPAPPIGK